MPLLGRSPPRGKIPWEVSEEGGEETVVECLGEAVCGDGVCDSREFAEEGRGAFGEAVAGVLRVQGDVSEGASGRVLDGDAERLEGVLVQHPPDGGEGEADGVLATAGSGGVAEGRLPLERRFGRRLGLLKLHAVGLHDVLAGEPAARGLREAQVTLGLDVEFLRERAVERELEVARVRHAVLEAAQPCHEGVLDGLAYHVAVALQQVLPDGLLRRAPGEAASRVALSDIKRLLEP